MRSPNPFLCPSNESSKEDMESQYNLDVPVTSASSLNGYGYKNLGRKKSNPAWAFFIDLRDQGLPGIKCRYCDFASDERSPITMKYHIKKLHNTGSGGLWSLLEDQYRLQAEGKAVDLSTSSLNCSMDKSFSVQPTKIKGLKHLKVKERPFVKSNGLSRETKFPILTQEVDKNPNTSESNALFQTKTELDESCAPLLAFETAVPSEDYIEPHRPRNSNLWIHLGRFDTEEEMHAVRSKQKVSKRRAEVMKHGTKIRYRCNRWKRTKCAYQMYAYFAPNSKIDLYESGEHDHSGEKLTQHLLKMQMQKEGSASSQSIPKQFQLSQEDILNSLLSQATKKQEIVTISACASSQNASRMEEENEEELLSKLPIQEENPTAQLLNMANVQFGLQQEAEKQVSADHQLLAPACNGGAPERKTLWLSTSWSFGQESRRSLLAQLATELDMTVDFGSTKEFTLISKFSAHKSIRFVEDQEDRVTVTSLFNQLPQEVWTKGDWSQFLWAVRGKCVHDFLLSPSSAYYQETSNISD